MLFLASSEVVRFLAKNLTTSDAIDLGAQRKKNIHAIELNWPAKRSYRSELKEVHMASTISQVRRHFSMVGKNVRVASRHLIDYGSRGAMDQAVYTLVKRGEIVRVSRGIFVRADSSVEHIALEVAQMKAAVFGKDIFEHTLHPSELCSAATALDSYDADSFHAKAAPETVLIPTFVFPISEHLLPPAAQKDFVVAATGETTSFSLANIRVRMKSLNWRKVRLGDDNIGLMIKKLWSIGKDNVDQEMIKSEMRKLGSDSIARLFERSRWMPYWLLLRFRNAYANSWQRIVEQNFRARVKKFRPTVVLKQ